MTEQSRWRALWLTCCVAFAGCGGAESGPERFHVSGTVTFDGKPLPHGDIFFEGTEKNPGPAGYSHITNGKYDTALEGGRGHIGGPLVARIVGTSAPGDPSADIQPEPPAKPPFSEWHEDIDLPKEAASTKDINIPKDADQIMKKKAIRDAA